VRYSGSGQEVAGSPMSLFVSGRSDRTGAKADLPALATDSSAQGAGGPKLCCIGDSSLTSRAGIRANVP
jgi:hypothetical protein